MSHYPDGNYWVTRHTLVLETLPDNFVLEFLLTDKKARADFEIIFPYLSEERQADLTDLINGFPAVKTKMYVDPQTRHDVRQHKVNTAGIHIPMTPRLKKLKKRREQE